MPFMPRRKDQLEILARLGLPPMREQIGDAWAFQCYCGPRLWKPLAAVWGVTLGACIVLAMPALLLFWLAHRFTTSIAYIDILGWPPLFQLAVLFGLLLPGYTLTVAVELSFIMVQRVRRRGRYTRKSINRDLGMAIERTLGWATVPWLFALALAESVLILVAHGFYLVMLEYLEPFGAVVVAGAAFLFFNWLLVFPYLVWQFAVLVRRDCGWNGAWDASRALVLLESRGGLVKSAWSFFMIFSIVGIPGGIVLYLTTLERLDILLSAILGEKTRAEIQKALAEEEPWNPTVLQPYFALIDRGRYLDALNGFQQYLYRHPSDIDALRGQAIAYLHMGHPKKREALERWNTEDPESAQSVELLAELNAGMWEEGGERYVAAQQRCTQPLGRGV
ncbi:MAG: tetratricopeptide repeat protein [Candidatus Sumerlaeia bacterium]|nr:tetratricopeptide repeat protein [Candidatus Sumerlaeia bacterium]